MASCVRPMKCLFDLLYSVRRKAASYSVISYPSEILYSSQARNLTNEALSLKWALEFPSEILAVNAIVEGVRPKKPEQVRQLGFSDELWRIVELSWLEDRNSRLEVEDILSFLKDAVVFWPMRVSARGKGTVYYAYWRS